MLTVDDDDLGATADTTYTYSLTSPSWTDPSGAYTATLDKFDRATVVNDPVSATDFTWAYRADRQPSMFGQPNGNWTESSYDALGRLTGLDSDTSNTTGGIDRAVYAWTYNRAGRVLTEAETITGGASNGTVTYGYDPLGRLTTSALYERTKQRLGRQRGAKVARVDIARKLAEAIWHILTRNEPFAPAGPAIVLVA